MNTYTCIFLGTFIGSACLTYIIIRVWDTFVQPLTTNSEED